MSQESNRVPCPHCQASNFPSSAVCWQCGQPLQAESGQPPTEQPPAETPPPSEFQPIPPPPGAEPPRAAPPPSRAGDTQTLIILGFIFAVLGICCCQLFSIAAIVLGAIALSRGDSLGTWVIVAGVVGLIIGIVLLVLGMTGAMFPGRFPWMGPGGPFPRWNP